MFSTTVSWLSKRARVASDQLTKDFDIPKEKQMDSDTQLTLSKKAMFIKNSKDADKHYVSKN